MGTEYWWEIINDLEADIDGWLDAVDESDELKQENLTFKRSDPERFFEEDGQWVIDRQKLRKKGERLRDRLAEVPSEGKDGVTYRQDEWVRVLENRIHRAGEDFLIYDDVE